MAGINFNDLPPKLQAKLQPYMTIGGAKTVEEAVAKAKEAKNWSAEDDKQLNALNGGANWGRTMDEYAFNTTKAKTYKSELPKAQRENQLAEARRKNNAEPSIWKTVGKYAGAGLATAGVVVGGAAAAGVAAATLPGWAVAGIIGAGVFLFTSCNKLDLKQEQMVVVPHAKDYSSVLEAISKRLDNIDNNYNTQFKNLLNKLDQVINGFYETQEALEDAIKKAVNDIMELLKQIQENQINIQIDNNRNAADIIALLAQILASDKSADDKLAEIVKLLGDIKSIGGSIDNTTKQILEEIKKAKEDIINTLNTNNKEVIAALQKLDENDQKTLAILNEIKALITKYGNQGNAFAEAILIAIGKMNGDLSGIEALLQQLVNGQRQTNQQIADLTSLLSNFSTRTANQLNTIISKLDSSSPDYSAQLNAIIALLEQLDANNDTRNQKILDAIDKLGANMAAKLSAILAKLDKNAPDYNEKLDAIIKLLQTLDANNETRNQKVLAAIEKLGVDVSANLTAILNAIKALPASQQKDYTAILNAILDKITEGNAQNNANFKAVLDKIGELGVNVMYGMNAILEAIQDLPDYTEKLNVIIAKLNALGDKAQEILEAIKDHDVKITVDVTGKVTCECNCNCGGSHEGILGDLNDLLG